MTASQLVTVYNCVMSWPYLKQWSLCSSRLGHMAWMGF